MTSGPKTPSPIAHASEEDFVPTERELAELEKTDAALSSHQNNDSSVARAKINPVHIVLVKPIYPRNIGMCARAIANFGFTNLVIVAPQTELGHEAKQGAAHAQKILRDARVYKTMDDFYAHEGEGLRIALSGKDARMKKSELIETTLSQITTDQAHPAQSSTYPIYLFFGAEDDGLSPEEMSLCHHVCRIPTYSEVTSLNLSHAVLLTSFLVRQFLEKRVSGLQLADHQVSGHQVSGHASQHSSLVAERQPAYYPHETIHRWLQLLGFDLSAPRVNIEKTLQRILLSQAPTPEELHVLNSLLHQTIRKLERS